MATWRRRLLQMYRRHVSRMRAHTHNYSWKTNGVSSPDHARMGQARKGDVMAVRTYYADKTPVQEEKGDPVVACSDCGALMRFQTIKYNQRRLHPHADRCTKCPV